MATDLLYARIRTRGPRASLRPPARLSQFEICHCPPSLASGAAFSQLLGPSPQFGQSLVELQDVDVTTPEKAPLGAVVLAGDE